MCGFLGEFSKDKGSLIDKNTFISLLDLSNRRGPDNQGYFSNKQTLQFGFNRLSIQDLSENSNQPIQSSCKRYTMLFNGEIYNHLELRSLLPSEQFNFQGTLDNAKSSGKKTSWRSLRDGDLEKNQDYQIIDKTCVLEFRKKVNEKLLLFIKENLPSLAETDKSLPPNDWIH